MSAFVLLSVGCAECRWKDSEPLVDEVTGFDSIEAAKASVDERYLRGGRTWQPHPLGGEYLALGDGDFWAAPVGVFTSA